MPCAPASNRAAITASRSAPGCTRTVIHSPAPLTRALVSAWLAYALCLRAQRFFHLRPEPLAAAVRRHSGLQFAKALHELPLFIGEPLGRPELHAHVQVARPAAIHARQSALAQVKHMSTLRGGRH